MAFKIQLTNAAERDIASATAFIHKTSPRAARNWLLSLEIATKSLNEMPTRFALASESDELERPIRSFPHYSHRVIYEVDEPNQTVSILRVYHSSRAPLQLEDLE